MSWDEPGRIHRNEKHMLKKKSILYQCLPARVVTLAIPHSATSNPASRKVFIELVDKGTGMPASKANQYKI